MKITASRKEDILREKEAYEADKAARKARHDEQYSAWRRAEYDACEKVVDKVKEQVGEASIDLNIVAQPRFWGKQTYQIHVSSEDNNVHGKDKALSWNWDVYLMADGTIEKESSSWSGLQATTQAHLASLEETLRVLRILNNIDWVPILTDALANVPNHDDYITEPDPQYADKDVPNYNQLLIEAELEEGIGKPLAFLGEGTTYRRDSWYMILSETPKMYTVAEVAEYYVSDEYLNENNTTAAELFEKNKKFAFKVRKDKLQNILAKPIQTMEVK